MTGAGGFHDGGGEGTVHDGGTANDGIDMGDGCRVQNCTVDSTSGGSYVAIDAEDAHNAWLANVRVTDSGGDGVVITGNDFYMSGCDIRNADGVGIQVNSPRVRCIGNYIRANVTGVGINIASTGDGFVGTSNTVDSNGTALVIHADAENALWVGNKTDGAVTESSGTSTFANNEETAFL